MLLNSQHSVEGRYYVSWRGEDTLTRDQLLEPLEKSLMYLAKNVDMMDIDIIFGVTLAQGQLINMDEKCVTVKKCLVIIEYLMQHAMKMSFPNRIQDVSELIFSPHLWMNLGKTSKHLQCDNEELGKLTLRGNKTTPNETQSDACLSELARVAKKNRMMSPRNTEDCEVSQRCKENLSGGNPWGYGLLHRILFNIIATSVGCKEINSNEEMCCKAMDEIQIIKENHFPLETADLFIEEVLVCSLSGYHQFLRRKWIEKVLQWQNPVGCWWDFVTSRGNYNKFNVTSRFSRSTKIFGGHDCSTHTTGVSIALLAVAAKHAPYL